jgi:hypothetical protein
MIVDRKTKSNNIQASTQASVSSNRTVISIIHSRHSTHYHLAHISKTLTIAIANREYTLMRMKY